MKRRIRSGLVVIFAGFAMHALAGCATSPNANFDHDPDVNFAKYQSFTWLSENPMKVAKVVAEPRTELQSEVMAAITATLQDAGYEAAASADAADFLISFTVGSREQIGSEAYPSVSSDTGGRGGWGTAYLSGGGGTDYTQGMLAIDIFDAEKRRPVWHGVTGQKIFESDRDNMDRIIEAAVTSVLSGFPPN